MIIIISIIVGIILLYLGLEYLYNEYRKERDEIEIELINIRIELQKEVKEMKKRYQINEQLIAWLYDEVNRQTLKGGKKK